LRLIESEAMFDRVAAGNDGIALPLAAVDVTTGLASEPVRLVDQRLQNGQRIRDGVRGAPSRLKRVGAGREQLDPVRAVSDLLATAARPSSPFRITVLASGFSGPPRWTVAPHDAEVDTW
jgi:hypothetical protein